VVLLLALSVAVRFARLHLAGVENATMAVWPGQVIFGFYFALLVFALQSAQKLFAARHAPSPTRRKLFLLVIIGLCLDFVLVNVQETVAHVDASYGFVALWDAVTFFAWLSAIESSRSDSEGVFAASSLVAIAPVFALGREILFVPYTPFSGRAYLDLFFGNLAVCLWVFVVRPVAERRRSQKAASLAVFAGCVYWALNAVENVAVFAWSPLAKALESLFARTGASSLWLSVLYAVIAISATLVVWRWDLFRLGTHFGIAKRDTLDNAAAP